MSILRCIIVEDEIPAAEELKYILSQYDFIQIQGVSHDGENGLNIIEKLRPDVVFIDINIPMQNGMKLARKIKKMDKNINIVFVTAYEQHALQAFEVEAVDYILKPYDELRIDKTVKRLLDKMSNNQINNVEIPYIITEILNKLDKKEKLQKRIPCDHNGKIILINVSEIYFCYIDGDKTFVKTKSKSYVTNYTLREIEQKTSFFRAHRSYLVNIDNIKELYSWFNGTYKIVMSDCENSEIPISRNNVKKLKGIIGI